MKILWGITGSGDKLAETVTTMKKLQRKHDLDIRVALSKDGEKVIQMYGLWKPLKEEFKEVLVEKGPNDPFLIGALQTGKYDLFLVCPATANTTAKIAHGIADSLISNCVSQALKANQRVYIYPVDQKPGKITTILPNGKKLTLTIRKTDLANVAKLKKMTGITVLSSLQDIERAIAKEFDQ